MDKSTINRIQRVLRNDFKISKVYSSCTSRSKVDKALFKCEKCGTLNYQGTSEKNYKQLVEKYKVDITVSNKKLSTKLGLDVTKMEVDHIIPVIDYDKYYYTVDWNEFISRLFCEESNLQYLCTPCHSEKSAKEARVRKLLRDKRK